MKKRGGIEMIHRNAFHALLVAATIVTPIGTLNIKDDLIKPPTSTAPGVRADRETDDRPYSILGGGPMTGWQTLPSMTLEMTESPTGWQRVQVLVGMGERNELWGGFSPEFQILPRRMLVRARTRYVWSGRTID